MSSRTLLPSALLLLTLSTVACSGAAATAAPTGAAATPAASPTAVPSPTIAGIAHPTGAKEIILRMDTAGGFVPPEFLAARIPIFTLYGDGTVVFVQANAEQKQRADNVAVGQPIRTAKLSEEQIQALLEFALNDGGIAIAKTEYSNMMISDAPTTTFEINAANDTKKVSVYALGMQEEQPGPDTAVLKQLQALNERLGNFDQNGTIPTSPYQAAGYRGVILEQQGVQGVPIGAWPWVDIKPADFKMPADPNALQQGTKTLSAAEVSALGIDGFENGISGGVFLKTSDGKVYSIVIRPLLPDESA